jgi:GNAT superfamily N-acetyltransferase
MRVASAGYRDIARWLELAAEVEDLFGPLLDDPAFYHALLANIERGTAFCVRAGDGPPGAPLLGGLLFSPAHAAQPEARIGWLAVSEASRRRGVGQLLVEHVLDLVAPSGVWVVTFGDDDGAAARAARRFYERLGFSPAEMAPPGPDGGARQVFRRAAR